MLCKQRGTKFSGLQNVPSQTKYIELNDENGIFLFRFSSFYFFFFLFFFMTKKNSAHLGAVQKLQFTLCTQCLLPHEHPKSGALFVDTSSVTRGRGVEGKPAGGTTGPEVHLGRGAASLKLHNRAIYKTHVMEIKFPHFVINASYAHILHLTGCVLRWANVLWEIYGAMVSQAKYIKWGCHGKILHAFGRGGLTCVGSGPSLSLLSLPWSDCNWILFWKANGCVP